VQMSARFQAAHAAAQVGLAASAALIAAAAIVVAAAVWTAWQRGDIRPCMMLAACMPVYALLWHTPPPASTTVAWLEEHVADRCISWDDLANTSARATLARSVAVQEVAVGVSATMTPPAASRAPPADVLTRALRAVCGVVPTDGVVIRYATVRVVGS